jgi:hypothetical protein
MKDEGGLFLRPHAYISPRIYLFLVNFRLFPITVDLSDRDLLTLIGQKLRAADMHPLGSHLLPSYHDTANAIGSCNFQTLLGAMNVLTRWKDVKGEATYADLYEPLRSTTVGRQDIIRGIKKALQEEGIDESKSYLFFYNINNFIVESTWLSG